MRRRRLLDNARSRYGLPKNFVVTERVVGMPPRCEPWVQARDEFDGQLYDTLDALQAGVIDRATFDREKARLTVARRKADARIDQLLRAPRGPSYSPRRSR